MRNKYLNIAIYTVLGILITFLVVFYKKQKIKESMIVTKSEIASAKLDFLQNKYLLEILDNSFQFNPEMRVSPVSEDTLSFMDILSEKPKLIFYFSGLTCESCVQSELLRLKGKFKNIDSDRIILLAAYENIRSLYLLCRSNEVNYPAYIILEDSFGLNADEQHLPYYFVANDEYRMKDFFIVDQNTPGITDKYLEIVFNKYFK